MATRKTSKTSKAAASGFDTIGESLDWLYDAAQHHSSDTRHIAHVRSEALNKVYIVEMTAVDLDAPGVKITEPNAQSGRGGGNLNLSEGSGKAVSMMIRGLSEGRGPVTVKGAYVIVAPSDEDKRRFKAGKGAASAASGVEDSL